VSRIVEVAAGLICREGKLLIARRRLDAHLGGLWEFPGGKREPGESFEACLQRELLEELGIEVVVGPPEKEVVHEYPDKTVRIVFLRCAWLRHEPQPLQCAEVRWVTTPELGNYEFPPADAELLAGLRNASL
jgi:mutator protein MutT